jgi:hypothetical protein
MAVQIHTQDGTSFADQPYAVSRANAQTYLEQLSSAQGAETDFRDVAELGSQAYVASALNQGSASANVVWEQGALVFEVSCIASDATALPCEESVVLDAAHEVSRLVAD